MKTTLLSLMQRKATSQIVVIFFVALLVRCLVLVYIGNDVQKFYTFDSDGYVALAENLVHNRVFSTDQEPPLTPDIKRTPIYPLFISATLVVFEKNLSATILLQILLGSITAVLTFCIAKKLELTTFAGLVAAWIVAIDPVSILLSNHLLTEALFTFELLFGIWLLILFWHNNKARQLVISAIIISLSVLTRPIALYLPVALFPLFIMTRRGRSLRNVIMNGLIFVLICGVIISSWSYRNYRVSNKFMLSSIADINLVYYRARAVLAKAENITQGEADDKLKEEIETTITQQNLSQAEIASLQRKRALQIFGQYPTQTAIMLAKGGGRLLFDPGFTIICTMLDTSSIKYECFPGKDTKLESGMLSKVIRKFQVMTFVQQATLMWGIILLGLIYFGLVGGIFSLIRERNWLAIFLLGGIILYFVLLSAGAEADHRLRSPIQPFLAILSGVGFGAMYKYQHKRRSDKETV
jgi:4-amino-4-deoxy-L-arabinose transferase-like glycosyltransferase